MKPRVPGLLMPDHPMFANAVDALRQYDEAQAADRPADEVERLRLIAEAQFQALNEYQLRALGRPAGNAH
ncbi:hypothetical protein MXM82_10690 [Pseudomonas asiatica]|uniref:hypothetical protein n=1 Tax=Pseudomonas asiatica TaxID=2219225 RepID=UPI002DB7042A|nr:hypothetical protein [Pseudomonas asiatica]MEB6589597.1 hypothetical protein [Pseudomonas asiatica]